MAEAEDAQQKIFRLGKDNMDWTCEAQTPIWTGDAIRNNGACLIPSGLLGSVRWWFEVLVRGFGGSACDPSDTDDYNHRCSDKQGHRCVVCELFGCTGWARKFRFEVVDCDGSPIQVAIDEDKNFVLRFTPLRPIRSEEWALLDLTLRLIAEYGAIGGRTVLKPSDEPDRKKELHHKDYGLIKILVRPHGIKAEEGQLLSYVQQSQWRNVNQTDFAWASLDNFWCVQGRHLSRQDKNKSDFNMVLGRDERKTCRDCGGVHNPNPPPQKRLCPKTKWYPRRFSEIINNNHIDRWIAGGRQESKKVFSFKKNPKRTFGFVKPGVIGFDDIKGRLDVAWPGLQADEFLNGSKIRHMLIISSGDVP
jgi:CRISPR-associated protein Cmr1